MLFVWVILIAFIGLSGLNILLSEEVLGVIAVSPAFGVLWTAATITFVFAVDAVTALLLRRATPAKWYDHRRLAFTVGRAEKNFYEKMKIRKWKDKIPEWGRLTGFSKNEIARPHDNAYLERYFLELCYGEAIHFLSVPAGFFTVLFAPRRLLWSVAVPVAIINAIANLPSLFILRYNSYKLEVLFKNNEKKAARRTEMRGIAAETE